MVRHILLTTTLIPTLLFSQMDKPKRMINKGLIRSQAIISFGQLLNIKETSMFIHGNIEYHTSEKFSIRSDLFYYIESDDDNSLKMNHQFFEGGSFHIKTKNNFDPYIGFQPGLALTETKTSLIANDVNSPVSSKAVNPLISAVIGFNLYATKFFHLFADARYIYGNHLSNSPPVSLNEVRVSFGLGINTNVLFRKKS